ncbi:MULTISPECIES: sensor histidine kinase [unclassified Nocardioides]|uniref:sensor histidine kinase n=1 Tax=unclassified Nocardioides TaxID=2615069 RepID=UPI0036240E51
MAGRPVARVVSSVLTRIGLLGAVATLVAVVGVVVSALAVQDLSNDLEPAAVANRAIHQDLVEMSATAESWASVGVPASADDYRQAALRLGAHEQEVRSFAADDRSLRAAVARQEEAAHAWIEGYAEPRLAADGGAGATERQVRDGLAALEVFRAAHQDTATAFDSRVRSARDAVSLRLRGTVLAVLLAGIVTAVVMSRQRRRLLGELSTPLLGLEKVVQRMARGDHQVRAEPAGPKEVQAVAHALNDLADAQNRARAVEVWIQRELRTLDTAKDDFVANVSHELRTPLTTISGYLEVVAEEFDGRMEPRHERILDATRRNVARLKLLIDDLLMLQRAEGSTQQMEPVDVPALVRDAVMDVKITAARRGIRIGLRTPELPVSVLADRAMLHRAFLNVLANAVKFSRDEGVVDVAISTRRGQVEVVVTDRGLGIPAEELDRLGTRFFRASNAVTNEIAGTGLGVRIMQTIIDRHGGAALFESEEGVGTTVTVRLPVQSGASQLDLVEPPERVVAPAP